MSSIHDKLTDRTRKVLRLAREAADRWGHTFVGPEHVLVGILEERHNVAANVLTGLGVSPEEVVAATMRLLGVDSPGETQLDTPALPPEDTPCSSTSAPSTS